MTAYDELKHQDSKETAAGVALFGILTNNESMLKKKKKSCLMSWAKTDDTTIYFHHVHVMFEQNYL